MIEILATVVEAELTLFEMKQKGPRADPAEPGQSGFGVTPEAFDPVNVVGAICPTRELVAAMVDAQVLLISQVHQAVVPPPAVGMDDAVERDYASNRPLEPGFGEIGDQLGVHLAVAFEAAEDRRFLPGAPPGFAFDASRTKVTFIHLDRAAEREVGLASLGHPQTKAGEKTVDGDAVQDRQMRDMTGSEIGGDVPHEATENSLGDS